MKCDVCGKSKDDKRGWIEVRYDVYDKDVTRPDNWEYGFAVM